MLSIACTHQRFRQSFIHSFSASMLALFVASIAQAAGPTQNLTSLSAEVKEALKLPLVKKKLIATEISRVNQHLFVVETAIAREVRNELERRAAEGDSAKKNSLAELRVQATVSESEYRSYISALNLTLGHIAAEPISAEDLIRESTAFMEATINEMEAKQPNYRMDGATYFKAKLYQIRILQALSDPMLDPSDKSSLLDVRVLATLMIIGVFEREIVSP